MHPSETLTELMCCVFYTLITIFGLIGNVAVCYIVYANKQLRTPSNYQLISLAIADGMVCLIASPMRLALTVKVLRDDRRRLELQSDYVVICKIQTFVINGSVTVSMLTLTTLSVVRALAIVGKCSKETLKTLIKIFIVFSYVGGIAAGTMKLSTGEATYVSCYNPTGESTTNHKIKYLVMIIAIVSLLTIMISYTCISVATRCHRRSVVPLLHQQQQASQNRMDIATLRVSVTIILCFLASYLPVAIYFFVIESGIADGSTHQLNVLLAMVCFGSVLNPIIYSLMSETFKRHLKGPRSRTQSSRLPNYRRKIHVGPLTGDSETYPKSRWPMENTEGARAFPSTSGLSARRCID
ncbi:QRFP-like peptide receptor [Ptychodera flava]|uniref:QRFP-like peptide receptor n=1 Tax=Ptychodera flava TaxID=63121 RepID=UPI00396A3E8B